MSFYTRNKNNANTLGISSDLSNIEQWDPGVWESQMPILGNQLL